MRLLVLLLCLIAGPALAETPWSAAETLRSEAGRIERLLYRQPTPEREAEIATRLGTMRAAWDGAAAASGWLNIRDYARASGDTAAVLAVKALSEGQLGPAAARDAVEAELLTVAASELRLALTRAAEDAEAGHRVQYAGDRGRIEGLVAYLRDNLTQRLGPEAVSAIDADLTRAADDPAALNAVASRLATYAPVALSPQEQLRRARLLRRFTALVWVEYKDGIRDGEISQPMEYHEARLFRDRAALILGDLAPGMADRATAERLAALLAEAKAVMDAKGNGVEPLVNEALTLIDRAFGAEVAAGGYAAAVDALPAALDELALVAGAGDWAEAELKRLEAYSWFDPDIEQRLVPRAPSMALRLEARFWEGTAARPGLGRLVADHAAPDVLAAEIAGIKADLAEARTRIETPLSTTGAVLQSAAILFREGLEAVLILAALMAALRAEGADPARYRRAIGGGVTLALVASFALWAGARWLFSISTLAREAIEGGTALVAAVVLVWMVLGLNAGGGHVARLRQRLAAGLTAGTVAMLAFLVVFREGFETVLFYEALLVDATPLPVLAGLVLGGAAALAAGWVLLASGRRLPLGVFFRVTSALLAVLAVMLVGAGIRGLQTAALIGATPVAWFPDRDWLQLWFGLFPVAEPLAAQAAVLVTLILPVLARRLRAAVPVRG